LRFLACGLIGIALYNALLNAGQQTVSASAASFIVNTVPILTALFATIFLNERFTRWGWAGAAVGFAGVGVIVTGQPGGLSFGSGAFLIFGSAVAQAAFFVIQKPLVPRYGALASTAYTILAGTLMLTPWMGQGLATLAEPGTALLTVVAVIALGVFPAALGYAAWSFALGHYGAARASTFLYLVPPVATLLAFALSGERPGLTTLLGGLIAIAGVALVSARGRPRP
jgi:drug/metabolite transporter (DMT)-like permease